MLPIFSDDSIAAFRYHFIYTEVRGFITIPGVWDGVVFSGSQLIQKKAHVTIITSGSTYTLNFIDYIAGHCINQIISVQIGREERASALIRNINPVFFANINRILMGRVADMIG